MSPKLAPVFALAALVIGPASAAAAISGSPMADAFPDPATWAMLLAGFGMIGFASRTKRTIGA